MDDGHFIATLNMLTTELGGRKTPFKLGYRPQLYLGDPQLSTSCFIHKIEGMEEVAPGESVTVEASLLMPDIVGPLQQGMRFEIREGGRPVGWGIIQRLD
jgi:elongation factor Tu